MQGVEIKDSVSVNCGGFLSFDLREILGIIGKPVSASAWLCHDVECTGNIAEELHRISAEGRVVSGDELVRIASGILQTIDGEFEAYQQGAAQPWLVIRAVDSTSFDVLSCDSKVLEKIRKSFQEVSDLPAVAA